MNESTIANSTSPGDRVLVTAARAGARREAQKSRRSSRRSVYGLLLIGGATLVSALGGRSLMKRRTKAWYRTLKKPSWTPPDVAFGLVWPVLYGLSAYSAWRIWRSPDSKARSRALGLWGAQMLTNAAWTPLFFGRKQPKAALVDIGGNFAAGTSYALQAGKIDRTAGLLMIPYVAWVGFASSINASVVLHNGSGLMARLGV